MSGRASLGGEFKGGPSLGADPVSSGTKGETVKATDDAAVHQAARHSRLVEIRCAFAERARQEAEAAAARVAAATRICVQQGEAVARAQAALDPTATHIAKEAAHRTFKSAVAAAQSRLQIEAAAAAWLSEINALNNSVRSANARVRQESQAAEGMLSGLARLSDTADASWAMAESAAKACLAARAALDSMAEDRLDFDVEPRTEPAAPVGQPRGGGGPQAPERVPDVGWPMQTTQAAAPTAFEGVSAAAAAELVQDDGRPARDWLVVDLRSQHPQAIVRLMKRDGRALSTLVDRLAGSDPGARGSWQILLSNFVDLVLAAAIEDACLEFPAGHPFWDQFTTAQSREIVRGLSALGFRFDGFSGFGDGRVPSARDLALAVGSTGLLPLRVRHWPKADEIDQLFSGVLASGDAFIAGAAPALTLGQMVRLLGHRADQLADLWNDWPRVRLLLFSTSV